MELTDRQTQDLVARIVEAAHPVRIILFGSRARGHADATSDIDVLVVAHEDAHRRKTAQAIYRHLLGSGLPVDVVVARPSDLEKYGHSPGLVYREALRDGRDLYVA
jgi:predicted nucleotidyltransferase